jgi:Enoyl-CoA hydratase/isomerase
VPSAKVGLPEVLIGILPNSGGTQRPPRLIGPKAAMEMIVSGRHVRAEEAKGLGIIDEIVPEGYNLILFIEPEREIRGDQEAGLAAKGIGRVLEMEDGERITRGALVWWPPQTQTNLVNSLGSPLDAVGNVVVDEGFRTGRRGIYGAGDLV